ncbi:MAG TPA: YfbK domain-containing protein, partial [Phaeodactylibacter sp.]|nr:YfbK domain-containing protein [Phaeodactylibacter sp.]
RALGVLVDRLREEDRISIITYCHEIQTVLQGVSGADKKRISFAIEGLRAYGGTAGGPALKKAYELAAAHLVHNGNNRILLCTDGDFNLGFSSDAEMVELVEQERDKGVYLSAFGFGMGNYKDQKLTEIAKHGNGNYAYIDSILEAKRIFGEALAGTLFTVADNAKIQLEFNPAKVAGYRLLGYEKRLLRREDFNDDSKDAAEIGAGQRVTALYEIVPAGVEMPQAVEADPLKYQQRAETTAGASEEWLTLKFRYIPPQSGESSRLLEQTVSTDELQEKGSDNFRLAAAAAGFGMLLRDSEHKGDLTWSTLQNLADSTVQHDPHGYRKELCVLIRNASQL